LKQKVYANLVFRSNALGTHFTIYDNGENPKKAAVIGDGIRQELAAVIYVSIVIENFRATSALIPLARHVTIVLGLKRRFSINKPRWCSDKAAA
jgi:hypothetical protein